MQLHNLWEKGDFFSFHLHLNKGSGLWNGETHCEVLNQGHRLLYKKYWTLLQKSLALYTEKSKCLAQTSESTSLFFFESLSTSPCLSILWQRALHSEHCHICVTGPKYFCVYADSGPESFSLRQLPCFSLNYVTIFVAQLNSYSFFDSLQAIFSLLLNSISLTFVLYSLLLILRHLVLRDKPVPDVIIQQNISHLLLPPTCLFHTSVSTGMGEIGKPFIFLIIISS